MKKLILTLVIIFSIGIFENLKSQSTCYVHLDKTFYVTGEIIWYKLNLPSFVKEKNTIVKTTLLDASGNNLGNHFNKSEGELFVDGYYKLPFELSSEVHTLIFSTTVSKNSPEIILAEIFVPIYNDLIPVGSDDLMNDTNISTYNEAATVNTNLTIDVSLDKEAYTSREKVNAIVSVSDASGNLTNANISVSVKDLELLSSNENQSSIYQGKDLSALEGTTFLNQIYIKGSYVKGEGEIIPKEIMGAYSAKENKLHFSVPNLLGDFHLEMPYYYGSKPIQFFPYIDDQKDLKVSLSNVGSSNDQQLAYNETVIEYIKLSRLRKKLFQRYTAVESNIQTEEQELIYVAPDFDKEFDITEYKLFENVASFLKEVKTPLRMKEKKGEFEGAMYMPTKYKSYSDHAESDPIYIVNGYLTRNSDFIGNLDLNMVTNLAMLYDPKKIRSAYKVFGATGVVGVTVNSKDIMIPDSDKDDIFNITGLLPEANFPVFDPVDISNDQYQPFFRPLLYWNSNLKTDNSGKANFSFHQSDDISTFVIEVVVQANDGSINTFTKTYQSVWQ